MQPTIHCVRLVTAADVFFPIHHRQLRTYLGGAPPWTNHVTNKVRQTIHCVCLEGDITPLLILSLPLSAAEFDFCWICVAISETTTSLGWQTYFWPIRDFGANTCLSTHTKNTRQALRITETTDQQRKLESYFLGILLGGGNIDWDLVKSVEQVCDILRSWQNVCMSIENGLSFLTKNLGGNEEVML